MEKSLPNNWVEVQLSSILQSLETGSRPKGGVQNIMSGIPSLGGEHLNSFGGFNLENIKYIPIDFAKTLKRGLILNEDILIVKDGATTGKTSFVDDSYPYKVSYVNEHVFICRVQPFVKSKYVSYFLRSQMGQQRILDNFAGAAQGGINTKFVNNLLVPLASSNEQQRIADKLDTLFSQLDVIKGAMDRIPQLLKNLRQQILTYAVTGKLTADWRTRNNADAWREEIASDCCYKVQGGGTPKGSKFENTGIPFLKVYNIVKNRIDFMSEPQYVSGEIQNSQIKKSITYPGDVVMNIVGPPLNKVAIIPDDFAEWNINQAITLFRPKEYLNNRYLYYFFCEGSSVNSLLNQTRGVVGQVNISLSQCRNFTITIPSLEEQVEIVTKVDALFEKLNTIESKYEQLKSKITNLPQSILHKAFSGELVEQLPTDGSATDLLKEIESLTKTVTKTKRKK